MWTDRSLVSPEVSPNCLAKKALTFSLGPYTVPWRGRGHLRLSWPGQRPAWLGPTSDRHRRSMSRQPRDEATQTTLENRFPTTLHSAASTHTEERKQASYKYTRPMYPCWFTSYVRALTNQIRSKGFYNGPWGLQWSPQTRKPGVWGTQWGPGAWILAEKCRRDGGGHSSLQCTEKYGFIGFAPFVINVAWPGSHTWFGYPLLVLAVGRMFCLESNTYSRNLLKSTVFTKKRLFQSRLSLRNTL